VALPTRARDAVGAATCNGGARLPSAQKEARTIANQAKRLVGRPPRPAEERHTMSLSCNVLPEMAAEVKRRARDGNVSAWLRELIARALAAAEDGA
jgi:hypothetical protein